MNQPPSQSIGVNRPGPVLKLNAPADDESPFAPVVTFVIWIGCALIGVIGLALPYPQTGFISRREPPITARSVQADLTPPPPPDQTPALEPNPDLPPPADVLDSPVLNQPVAVASPVANVAFALPVEGPVRVVDPRQAGYSRPAPQRNTNATASTALVVNTLVFGEGEGRQPKPDYPLAARRDHQEGIVLVRMIVNEDGTVRSAEVVRPCIWPLLNAAARQAVRQHWHFEPGEARIFEVPIQFELKPR